MSEEGEVVETEIITVKVVEQRGPSVVVEWEDAGSARRSVLPAPCVDDGQCALEDLRAGAPASIPWQDYFESTITAKRIAELMQSEGVWTMEDFGRRGQFALHAVQRIVKQDFYAMLRRARDVER